MTTPQHQAKANRKGIVGMTAAMGFFLLNDSLVKYVSETLPIMQLIFVRGIFCVVLLGIMAQVLGHLRASPEPRSASDSVDLSGASASLGLMEAMRHRSVWLRGLFDVLTTYSFIYALFHLPLANATAISMATPFIITLLAIVYWRERVSLARWLALVVGFVGVMLVVQPAAQGFNAWALLGLLSALMQSLRDLATRSIPRHIPATLVSIATAGMVAVSAGVMSLFIGFVPMTPWQLLLLLAAAAFLGAAYFAIVTSMRSGDMSLVAPFRYTALLFAILTGWAVWGDWPNAMAWCGIVLLVLAGIYVLISEQRSGLG